MAARGSYHLVKEVCVFLLSLASIPSGKALAIYAQALGQPFLFYGAIHAACPSAVLSLLWPNEHDKPNDGVTKIGVSVEDSAMLPPVADTGAQQEVERLAHRYKNLCQRSEMNDIHLLSYGLSYYKVIQIFRCTSFSVCYWRLCLPPGQRHEVLDRDPDLRYSIIGLVVLIGLGEGEDDGGTGGVDGAIEEKGLARGLHVDGQSLASWDGGGV